MTPVDLLDLQWFALRVVSASEFKVENHVKALGHKTLAPVEDRWRRYGAAAANKREKPYPIYVGYVFVGFAHRPNWYELSVELDRRHPTSRLVHGVVGFDGKPAQLKVQDVEHVMQQQGQAIPSNPDHKSLKVGDRVRITKPAFAGHEAVIQDIGAKKTRVLMDFLGTGQIIDISLAELERA